uniref:Uncharacterized protein n=1 Tax=Ditylenchus dipsaci TaxID=166011 RepID=A0A915CTZ0_9BILA
MVDSYNYFMCASNASFLSVKSLRIAVTNIILGKVACSAESIAQLELIGHVWFDQQLNIQQAQYSTSISQYLLEPF